MTTTRLNRYARLLRERAKVEAANQQVREQAALIDQATEVIVVTDLAGVREIIKATLETDGYRVLTTSDGTAAVTRFVEHLADVRLLLTDMQMPHLDGTATIRALRRLKPDLLVVASSGLTSHRDALAAAGVAVQGFLAKPFTAETLLRELATALQPQPSPQSPPPVAAV